MTMIIIIVIMVVVVVVVGYIAEWPISGIGLGLDCLAARSSLR